MSDCKACGYNYDVIEGDVKEEDRFIRVLIAGHEFNADCLSVVDLFACPKCGTVIMGKWGIRND